MLILSKYKLYFEYVNADHARKEIEDKNFQLYKYMRQLKSHRRLKVTK